MSLSSLHQEQADNKPIYRPGELVSSAEGKELQRKVWAETVEVLATEDPEMETLIDGLAS